MDGGRRDFGVTTDENDDRDEFCFFFLSFRFLFLTGPTSTSLLITDHCRRSSWAQKEDREGFNFPHLRHGEEHLVGAIRPAA